VGTEPEAAAEHVSERANLKFTDCWEWVGPFEEKEGRGFPWDPCRVVGSDREAVCGEVNDGCGVLWEFVALKLVLVDDVEAI
jgi:hypothetical protein